MNASRPTRRTIAFLAVMIALGGLGAALARGPVTDYFREIRSAPTALRTVNSNESTDFDTPVDAQPTKGNANVYVWGTFSSQGATATVEVSLHGSDTGSPMGIAWVGTLTGSSSRTADSGRWAVEEVVSTSTRSAPFYDVRVRDVSAGNFEPIVWTGNLDPEAAQ